MGCTDTTDTTLISAPLEEKGAALKKENELYSARLADAREEESRLLEAIAAALAPYLYLLDGPPPPLIDLLPFSDRGRGIRVATKITYREECSLWLCAEDPPGAEQHRARWVEASTGGERTQALAAREMIDRGYLPEAILAHLHKTLSSQTIGLQRKGRELALLASRLRATLLFVWGIEEVGK